MAILETALGIVNGLDKLKGLYDWCTGISMRDRMKQMVAELESQRREVRRLSDQVLYCPSVQQITTVVGTLDQISKEAEVKTMLEPLGRALESECLATAVVSVPYDLKSALERDTRQVLADVRPLPEVLKPPFEQMVPVIFTDKGTRYVGWQMPFVLQSLFGCKFKPGLEQVDQEYEVLSFPALTRWALLVYEDKPLPSVMLPGSETATFILTNKHLIYSDKATASVYFQIPRSELAFGQMFVKRIGLDCLLTFELINGKKYRVRVLMADAYDKLKKALNGQDLTSAQRH